jgi:hypothetical protein
MKKSQNSRNQGFSFYFCLMTEGSRAETVPATNGSGCGSRRPKNIRIRIRNFSFNHLLLQEEMLVLVESAKKHREKRTNSTKVVVERKDDVGQREFGVESVVEVTEAANNISSSGSSQKADKESSEVEEAVDDDVKNQFLERIQQLEECC